MHAQEAAAELLARRQARNSLISFTEYTFPTFQAGVHHRTIADALERVERGECRRLMIFAPPRHTKSELASRRFPAWYVGRNPDKQIICATYGQGFADDFGRDVRQIVRSEEFRALFPHVALAEDSQAQAKWRTEQGGIYIAAGVDGPLTGRGAHLALIDDPFKDRKDAESETMRNNVWHWYTSVLRTRLMPGGAIVLIMTRWHEDDLAGRLLTEQAKGGEQWEVVKLPAISEGMPLWPEWFGLDELEAIRRAVGPRDWLALYQQEPTAEEGDYFRREWFRRYDALPKDLNVYLTGDFAVTADGGDFTELAVWGVCPMGNMYALDWWSGQTTSDVWIARMIALFKRFGPIKFIGEGGPIRRAVEPYLKKAMDEARIWTILEWLTGGGDKAANARSFQAMAANGRVYLPANEWAETLIDQLLKFPNGKHDDKVDTCSLMGRFLASAWAAQETPEPRPVTFDQPLKVADFIKPRKVASW